MDRHRVLVVEDNPGVLKAMATILESTYQVAAAPDGATALSIIRSAPIDAVLADIRMRGLTGFEVLRAVQSHAPGTPVVMMTAYANVPDAVAAIKLGAYDYVAKPLDADEILLLVARAVEHRTGSGEQRQAAPTEADERRAGEGSHGGDGYHGQEECQEVSVEFRRAIEDARDRASREYLAKLLRSFRGNVTKAARRAGMTRESLHRVLRKYGVSSGTYKDQAEGAEGLKPAADSRQ